MRRCVNLVGEPGPTIDLGEQICNVDVKQEAVELLFKRPGSKSGTSVFNGDTTNAPPTSRHALKLSDAER